MPHMKSSAILDVDYTPEKRELKIKFHSDRTYVFFDVPKVIYTDLITASSAGDYFNRYIDQKFASRLLPEDS